MRSEGLKTKFFGSEMKERTDLLHKKLGVSETPDDV